MTKIKSTVEFNMNEMNGVQTSNPWCVFVVSGKRKSGKDFFTEILLNRLGSDAVAILRLSAPIKKYWSENCGLDFSQLLDSSSYKEKYRQEMIKWGEAMREKDPGYFCRIAVEMSKASQKAIWIVSDARRKTDIKWFLENFPNVKTLRISADIPVRESRGWVFTEGVDDAPSECDLDDYSPWDLEILNNGEDDVLEKNLNAVLSIVKQLGITVS